MLYNSIENHSEEQLVKDNDNDVTSQQNQTINTSIMHNENNQARLTTANTIVQSNRIAHASDSNGDNLTTGVFNIAVNSTMNKDNGFNNSNEFMSQQAPNMQDADGMAQNAYTSENHLGFKFQQQKSGFGNQTMNHFSARNQSNPATQDTRITPISAEMVKNYNQDRSMYAKTPLQQRGRQQSNENPSKVATHRIDHSNILNQKRSNKSYSRPSRPEEMLERIRIYN